VIERSDVVLSLASEPLMQEFLESLNPNTRSLHGLYELGRDRGEAYEAMTEEILRHVRDGLDVCAAFYGHPGVFVDPSHEAVRRAQDEGYRARMLPAVSAEDCLFADLGVDPCSFGCQSYEATDFLVRQRRVDPTSAVVLWQIGTVGNVVAAADAEPRGLGVLVETLLELYPPDHEVIVYEASAYPGFAPIVRKLGLAHLAGEHVTALSTLYIPPLPQRPADVAMLDRLGLSET
jgi:uncharacterized protein YabN with tetrapyrrole methylase and pyrophosphatase domain